MYKGMSRNAATWARPIDMSAAVLQDPTAMRAYTGNSRMYGAGAREAADERLNEEVKARHAARRGVAGRQQRTTDQNVHDNSLAVIDEQLADARRRREFLEEELEKAKAIEDTLKRKRAKAVSNNNVQHLEKGKAEKERMRQAAFKRKLEESGGKPSGVTKRASPSKVPAAIVRKFGNKR
ncbi:uncharacterized protein K460DRAFT_409702 [Cucurbitaria berberidis CBS 394.84]|uniref:Uncharacterized protein n=1 Tax=Cucurbitaria berberidis CBS 394.84 TaxID=1168544 RepID=A0A9P4L5F5_9PLEO|nr:uncharacterized protein K460DRAFT_409702 [Cucurbitaria berberidis CBS 394.84]KAF1842287.1 hypothetical protein K460DRAFT_409702 [Cucurbitaria berberidis CBS 394.84]